MPLGSESRMLLAKVGTIAANGASIASFVLYITERRAPVFSPLTGAARVNVVIHLAVLTAISYGVIWSLVEKLPFGRNFGAGGLGNLPVGWSAVMLSLSVTIPLAVVPFLYQMVAGVTVITGSHWRAMLLVVLFAAVAHLILYGTEASPRPNGLRERIMPQHKKASLSAGLLSEAAYATVFFALTVLPYRLIVEPGETIEHIVVGRTLLPAGIFFGVMASFIVLRYPGSVREPAWVQARGIIGGLAMMFGFCGGMFF